MTVLITGATGFIGRALGSRLVSEGKRVRSAVRSVRNDTRTEQFVVPCIGPSTDWNEALESAQSVVHLAAHVHVMKAGTGDEKLFHEVNVEGTVRLAEAAASAGVGRFIFLSTVKVHGERTYSTPFSEQTALQPEDAYARSKAEAEIELKRMGEAGGMEIVIIRPPLVYGPGVKANFLALLRLVQRGLPLPLAGIRNLRSMLYIGNLIDAMATCLEHPSAGNQTFLVSDGKDVSTPELVRVMADSMRTPARLFSLPEWSLRALGIMTGKTREIERMCSSLQIDSSFIHKSLGWKPPFSMKDGIQETVNWFLESNAGKVHGQ